MIHLLWMLPVAAVLVLSVWIGIPHALRKRAESRLRARCRDRGVIVLTYDDGPGAELTPRLLQLLDEHEASATFFLLGVRAEACPDVVDRLVSSGHEVATHSHSHRNAWKTDPFTIARDLTQGWDPLERRLGRPLAFRPPYGKATLASMLQAGRAGRTLAWWTHDSGDTWRELPSVGSVIDRLKADRGGVVLLHDFDQQRSPERVEYVVELTRAVLEFADEQSMRVMSYAALERDAP